MNIKTMYQNCKREIDPLDPLRPLYQGTFEETVQVGNQQRRYLVYIPEGARPSTAGVFVLPENGKTADDLWKDSQWRMIADTDQAKEKLIVFFLEPENGQWNTQEPYGKPDGDVAYIQTVYAAGCERFKFCVHESKFYLTGCREGGVLANMAAMNQPALWAGVCSVGGSVVSDAYMSAASDDYCTNLDGFVDESHKKNIKKGQIGMPAWIIDDPEVSAGSDDGTADYWKRCCGITEGSCQTEPDTLTFVRTEPAPYEPNQERAAFRVCVSSIPGSSNDYANCLLPRIWKDFLYRQRRWMSGPGGDLRVTKDPVADLGMEYHCEEIGGWMREWYVYVPRQVKENPEHPAPLVFAMHGYTCSGEIYAGNSEWYKVADKYGFIVIHPTATPSTVNATNVACSPDNVPLPAWNFMHTAPNGPDELLFFRTLLEKTCASYAIDRTRVFATGHSHGSVMTQTLAMTMPDIFAAVAPCSGVLFSGFGMNIRELPEIAGRKEGEVPIWMFGGEREEWLLPPIPANDNDTGDSIRIWRSNNHMEPSMPENWEDGWTVHGRWHDLTYRREDGAPMVRYTCVEYMPHATMTEMSFRIWEEFFSKFSKADGKIVYCP
ncbi:PHB depolymerase family esterase [Pusillibacter faecalis]|uniref:PHB depolymerase family esterase n=1 Tax=Pusillibacter faecalis TaxID=2714358 RepID=UPI002943E75A|nr:PHB depolymerase family esterase [Pusillibacter faecalis]